VCSSRDIRRPRPSAARQIGVLLALVFRHPDQLLVWLTGDRTRYRVENVELLLRDIILIGGGWS